MIHGATSRGEARSAARKRGIETVIKLLGLTVREEDRGAVEARQAAGWQWVALHHPELAEMRRPLRFVELRPKRKVIAPM
jgi:hypothetical protein